MQSHTRNRNVRLPQTACTVALALAALVAPRHAEAITTGIQNQQTVNCFTVIYENPDWPPAGEFPPDSDMLHQITLDGAAMWQNVRRIGTQQHGHTRPHQFPCPPGTYSKTYSYTNEYSKSWSRTTVSSIDATLGAEFEGIGASLESSHSIGFTVGSEQSWSETISDSWTGLIEAGGSATFYLREHWTEYSGTISWYEDTINPFGGELHIDDWAVRVNHETDFIVELQAGTACPEPAGVGVLGLAVVSLASFARRPGTRRPG